MTNRRETRTIEFTPPEVDGVADELVALREAGEGWVNLLPGVYDEADINPPTGLFAFFGTRQAPVTMATVMPARRDKRSVEGMSVGLMHPTGAKAIARLAEAGVVVPGGWVVRQDHARRGLVLRTAPDTVPADIVTWCVQAGTALCMVDMTGQWQAVVYLPKPGSAPMATGERRDDAALAAGLARWVADHAGTVPGVAPGTDEVAIAGLAHAEGGMANETVLVDFGPGHAGMVVRLPPLDATFPDYDLAPQAAVQNAVAAAGVPAPAPAILEPDVSWLGAPFFAMPRVRGSVAGPAPAFDPYVLDAGPALQRVMHDGLIDAVAAVHAVRWDEAGLADVFGGQRWLADALERWTAYVDWSSEGDPLPALGEALDWCTRHRPPEREAVLLWGDVRLGNLVFDDARRIVAVLDWDLAALGPREMDLGWHFGLDFMMEELFGRRVPGFPSRVEALERYERETGHEVRDLAWHEVFALARALAVNDRHQRITGDPRRRDNPMGAVLLARLEAANSSIRS